MNTGNSIPEKLYRWIKNSVSLKLFLIGMITILLLIPAEMIRHIIAEREEMQLEATEAVNSMWAENQLVTGPVLNVPFIHDQEGLDEQTGYLTILPEKLVISGSLKPDKLERGIYEVIVYRSEISISGNFDLQKDFSFADPVKMLYDQAFLSIGITDMRGIEEEIDIRWDKRHLDVEPASRISGNIGSGITAEIPGLGENSDTVTAFSLDLTLRGSRNLSFVPVGGITLVNMVSTWSSPSFNGHYLPDRREITSEGFSAEWKILELNRNYPQQWTGIGYSPDLAASAFGIDLINPVDDYQKSMRSVKYAIMTVLLTFLVFFLVEILNGIRIHPFQYGLVGLALCLFFILLVSFSEYLVFNLAYILSASAVILMIGSYAVSVFRSFKISLLLAVILAVTYGFLFVTLQLSDYALLLGSIGLAMILGFTMYITRNIDWYELNVEKQKEPAI